MLKIVYPVCCGIDVHKTFIYCCIATTDNKGITTYKSNRFSTFTNQLKRCATWLKEKDCKDVCMESTGKYWIPVYNILELSCNIVLTHPKYVKAIKGKKTDKRDAKWIADLFKHDLINGSFIPPGWYSSVKEFNPLSKQANQFYCRWEKPCAKLPDCFQYQIRWCFHFMAWLLFAGLLNVNPLTLLYKNKNKKVYAASIH